jgi:hypothetical protein
MDTKDTKEFVHNLFAEYEETAALRDFEEELLSNLEARIASLAAKGMESQAAFEKATEELGDISVLADQISLRKKQEIIQDAYMGMRAYLKPGRVALYVAAGTWAVFGVIAALVVYFTGEEQSALEAFWEPNKRMVGSLGVLLAFIPPAAAVFTFLGITQETARRHPLSVKRGAWYALAAAVLSFGLVLSPLTWFSTDRGLMEAIATLIPFIIPGLALLIFLLLTERDVRKPWAREQYEKEAKASREIWSDPLAAARFGMASGAIWISAVGFFILLGLLLGFKFSWLVFIFAVAVQLAAQSFMMKPNRNGKAENE